jgi:protein tyrosine phosphatase (PTP) superfamily phosphohydrolase (DUF442 family)/ribosomal protein S18 acetylase RimI-like enzyme
VSGAETIRDFLRVSETLSTGGQPTADELRQLAAEGCAVVVNLGLHDPTYCLDDEAGLVASLGMEYHHIPVVFEGPHEEQLRRFVELLDRLAGRRAFVHCAANKRVSCFVALYGELRGGWSRARADGFIRRIWEPDAVWSAFIAGVRRTEGVGTGARRSGEADVTVRRATLEDREALCSLYHDFHEFHVHGVPDRLLTLGDPPARFEGTDLFRTLAEILESEDAALFVAVERGAVIGLAEVYVRDDVPNPARVAHRYGHLQSLMVSSAARRRGAGRLLATAAAAWAGEHGASEMRVDTWEFPGAPGAFYERVGYCTVRRTWVKSLC